MEDTTSFQKATVQLKMTWEEYTTVLIAFKQWVTYVEESTKVDQEGLWDIYKKMYLTRKIEEGDWVNSCML